MPTQDLIKFGSSIPCKLILNIPLQKINHQEISHLNENAFEETPSKLPTHHGINESNQ